MCAATYYRDSGMTHICVECHNTSLRILRLVAEFRLRWPWLIHPDDGSQHSLAPIVDSDTAVPRHGFIRDGPRCAVQNRRPGEAGLGARGPGLGGPGLGGTRMGWGGGGTAELRSVGDSVVGGSTLLGQGGLRRCSAYLSHVRREGRLEGRRDGRRGSVLLHGALPFPPLSRPAQGGGGPPCDPIFRGSGLSRPAATCIAR